MDMFNHHIHREGEEKESKLRHQKFTAKILRESSVVILPIIEKKPRYVGIFTFKFVIQKAHSDPNQPLKLIDIFGA